MCIFIELRHPKLLTNIPLTGQSFSNTESLNYAVLKMALLGLDTVMTPPFEHPTRRCVWR